MKKETNFSASSEMLRRKAEKLIGNGTSNKELQLPDFEKEKLIHELEVHQIELELQNEELIEAKVQTENISQKYIELYDFAPTGYVTLSGEGNILESNFVAARILGRDRDKLINSRFGGFVTEKTSPDFRDFLYNVFGNQSKVSCEISIKKHNNKEVDVLLTGIVSQNGTECLVTMDDISERILSEYLLKISERKRIAILDKASDGYFLFNQQGRLLEVNNTYCNMTGYSKEELLNMHLSDLEPDQAILDVASLIQQIIIQGEVRYETIHRRIDGSLFHVEVSIQYQPGNEGQFITFLHDISLRKRAEESLKVLYDELEERIKDRTTELLVSNAALMLTESKYRTVADYTYDWEYWLNTEGHYIYVSPSCERISGRTAEEFIQNPGLILEIVHPDDLKAYVAYQQIETTDEKCPHENQFRIIHTDGSIRWIEIVRSAIYDKYGTFIGIRGSKRDITARKKMEQLLKTNTRKYALLSENINDGIFICRGGRFEYVNKSLNHMFGYNDQELIGLKLKQLVLPEYFHELDFFQTLKAPLNQIQNLEIECYRKDGSVIFVEFLFNYVAKEGVIYGVAHDVTEKRLLHRNMVKAIILTEEKERAYFSKELHDGLGPLLSVIKLYLQWSERSKNDASRDEIIHRAEDILEEALNTVKEISNKLSPHLLTNYGLRSAIQSFIDKLQETSGFRIEFNCNLGKRLGDEIEAAVYRAIIECLNNTIKHSEAKNVTIDLIDTGNELQMQYTDDGIGFNPKKTISEKKGLGLFNLQNRIQNIGGTIGIFSKPGKGVKYQITVKI